MGAAADCEAIGPGFLGQPVNTVTTLAFLLVGLWILLRRRKDRWLGIALVATGVGSFLFHGPTPIWQRMGPRCQPRLALGWSSLATAPAAGATVTSASARRDRVAVGVAPGVADPLAVAFTAFGVTVLLWRDRSWATLRPLLLLAVVGIYGRLGATGGPFCDASSVWQPHGIWHLGAAAALWWLFRPLRSLGSRVCSDSQDGESPAMPGSLSGETGIAGVRRASSRL